MSQLTDMLTRHEGVRLKPYHDTVGKLTIGIGRNLDDVGISRDEAEYLLTNDVNDALAALRGAFPWFALLNPARQDVLADMAFNMGLHRLEGFHLMLAACEHQDFHEAAKEMRNSHWAAQVGARAIELATMMETGSYV